MRLFKIVSQQLKPYRNCTTTTNNILPRYKEDVYIQHTKYSLVVLKRRYLTELHFLSSYTSTC